MRRAAFVLALALGASACGGAATTATSGTPAPQATAPTSGASGQASFPDVEVVDMASGATVSLADYPTDGRPVLLWFWSPH